MLTIHLARPEFLLLLLLIPLLAIAHYLLFRSTRRRGMIFANFETIKRVTGKQLLTKNRGILFLRILALMLLIFAMTGPELWRSAEDVPSDYVIAIDTSASMLADDLEPDRLTAAKRLATAFVDSLDAPTSVGIIGFAGSVTVEQLLTTDHDAVRMAITNMEVQRTSGTDIGSALVTGTNLLLGTSRGRVIILLTDGSSTVGTFKEDPVGMGARYAQQHQTVVHTIGMGTPDSTPSGYLPRLYNISATYDEETLIYIANMTSGGSFAAATIDELDEALLGLLERSGSTIHTEPLFLHVLLAVLLLLIFEWGLENTRFRILP